VEQDLSDAHFKLTVKDEQLEGKDQEIKNLKDMLAKKEQEIAALTA